MKKHSIYLLAVIIAFVGSACKQLKKPEALAEREQWIESFKDSIKLFKEEIEQIDKGLSECNLKIATQLDNFEHVSNPRQVTGYYILKGWNSKLPFTHTAIYARVNEDEKLELIATLAGSTFNSISVSDGTESLESEIVAHDQAFNYRHNGYNTVCFSGSKADSIAQFIAQHQEKNIKINFLEGKKKGEFSLPADEKSMIAETWRLFESQHQQKELQKQLWIISRKIDASRRMLENNDSTIK